MNQKTLGQVLGAVGLAVLVTSPILLLFGAAGTSFVLGQAVVGVVLCVVYLALDPTQVGRLLSGRGTFFAATAGGIGIVLVAALAVANYLAASKFPKQWDLTRNHIYTLSEDTQKTLKALKAPVHAWAFYVPTDRQYGQAKELLERYHDVGGDKFVYEFLDPDKNPKQVREFNVKKDAGPELVIEAGRQQDKVQQLTEEGLTNSLVKVTHGGEKKIYFLTGHGEADIKDTGATGYSDVVKALQNEGIDSESLSLLETKEIPHDCEALIIAGPQKKLLPQELSALESFLSTGGHLIAELEPQVDSGLTDLLKKYGVQVNDDEIIDPLSRLAGTNLDVPVVSQYGQHAITKGFNLATVFPTARSLTALSEGGEKRPLALATTNPTAWGETDFKMLAEGRASKEGKLSGSLAVAMLVEKPVSVQGKDDRSKETRIVVFGDSEFPDNRWSQVGPGNEDLFMNTVSWITSSSDRITIRPKSRDASHLTMNQQQMLAVQFFSIDVLPVLLLAVGIAIWRVRRSK
ncbi:MAG: GldG family protein [Deltaproteobacteria bacterium]